MIKIGLTQFLILILLSNFAICEESLGKAEEELKRLEATLKSCQEEVQRLEGIILELREKLAMVEKTSPLGEEREKEAKLKSNMHTLQLAAEDFSTLADGAYPVDINISIEKTTPSARGDQRSIADAYPHDPAKGYQINSSEKGLLPGKGRFTNPYDPNGPALATSLVDPPVWLDSMIGVVWYVPIEVGKSGARGYKIYGAGEKGLLKLILMGQE